VATTQTARFSKTIDGVEMDLWDLPRAIVTVEHIGFALARINRYAGHWRHPISVARHCITLAKQLKEDGHNELTQLQGLLHDAAEAYTTDIPSPLKALLMVRHTCEFLNETVATYDVFESQLTRQIFEKLGVSHRIPQVVWDLDRKAYHQELPILRGEVRTLDSIEPEVVERLFINRARELMNADS